MSSLSRICLVAALLVVVACSSTPLPRGEIPAEFLFEYERDRPEGDDPAPTFVMIQVDNTGEVSYEVQHIHPKRMRKNGKASLSQNDFARLYEEIRAAKLYEMDDLYTGEDDSYGRESFFVVGRGGKDKEVIADGVQVARMENLREVMLTILPVEEILGFPAAAFRDVIMDKRTGETFPANHDLVKTIPEEYRVKYKNWWQALNAGGFPSPKVQVPELRR